MRFLDIAKTRYSCRSYRPEMIEDEKIRLLMEAARIAPSAANFQPWHFILVRSPEAKAKVCETYTREWLKLAPLIIIACGDHQKSWKRKDGKDHLDIDLGIVVDHITLQATELGLATCWICNFDHGSLKRNLNMPDYIEPVVILPVGYPNDASDPNRHDKQRKPQSDIVHWEKFDI
jgi:nitroreductase